MRGVVSADLRGDSELPGVGEYTAAAVASIAFDLPHAVLDGNVFRVLSRVLDDDTNIASARAASTSARSPTTAWISNSQAL